jgi:hypothetical protein
MADAGNRITDAIKDAIKATKAAHRAASLEWRPRTRGRVHANKKRPSGRRQRRQGREEERSWK